MASEPEMRMVAATRRLWHDLGEALAKWDGGPVLEAPVEIDYTNYRGERRVRRIQPIQGSLRFKETPDHKPAQWVFDAVNLETGATRTFAMKDVHSWRSP